VSGRTGIATIPQVFVGGEFVGGCTDVLDAWRTGRMQALLERHGVSFDPTVNVDPGPFLPAWMHPRRTA
jgi:cysteine synthase A